MRLRVMTYNIRHGCGIDGQISLARVGETISSEAPVLVALQEVDHLMWRTYFFRQAAWLGRRLNMHHAFGANITWFGFMAYGNAILSDRPFVEVSNYHLPGRGERRGMLVVRRPDLVFACTHLGLDAGVRREQVRAVVKTLRPYARDPIVLAGDFNCRRDAPELEELHAFLQDTASREQPYTYPAASPEVKIDYVFTTPGFTCARLSAPRSMASDHLPLCADLGFTS